MSSSFSFRQRIGKLNWKIVSSIDMESVIMGLNIQELQAALDSITFCEFDRSDVTNNSVENISKLVHMQQLITEYLLHCQESNYSRLQRLSEKSERLKRRYLKLERENTSLIEDSKIYQRQIATLRQSLLNSQDGDRNFQNTGRIPPKLIDLYGKRTFDDKDELIESIINREKETRKYMDSMLASQRETFIKEMGMIMETVKSCITVSGANQNSNQNVGPSQSQLFQLQAESDKCLQLLQQQILSTVKEVAMKVDSNFNKNGRDAAVSSLRILQESSLETMDAELQARERVLARREREVAAREQTVAAVGLQSGGRASAGVLRQKAQSLAARCVLHALVTASAKSAMRAFTMWKARTMAARLLSQQRAAHVKDKALTEEGRRRAMDGDALAWSERYNHEKESALILQAKLNKATRDLEDSQSKVKDLTAQLSAQNIKEGELAKALKEEKQRAVVAIARLNTTQSKTAKDVAALEDKLSIAESVITKQQQQLAASALSLRSVVNPSSTSALSTETTAALRASLEALKPRIATTKDSGVGTSVDFSSDKLKIPENSKPSRCGNTTNLLAAMSPATRNLFLNAATSGGNTTSDGHNENDLLESAEMRILFRKNTAQISTTTVRTLAEELNDKLKHTHH